MFSKISLKPLIISVAIALSTGFIGSMLGNASTGYAEFIKPKFSPPSVVFPIVWTILYILMGISAYLVYDSKAPQNQKKLALTFYGLQLIANALWTFFFFNLQLFLFSFFWVILIIVLVIITAILFYKINPISGYLLVLYILWLIFAAFLNYSIYLLN